MIINLVFDSFSLAAPQSFRDGVQAGANLLQQAFDDNITVNIGVHYGEQNGFALSSPNVSFGDASMSSISYSALRADLIAAATSADDIVATNALPNTGTLGGQSSFNISHVQQRLFGLATANDATMDGDIYIGTAFSGVNLVTTALRDLTEAMGRTTGHSALTAMFALFRYSAPGQHIVGNPFPDPPSYFSIDGGVTSLADQSVSFHPADFLSPPSSARTPNDPFGDAPSNLGFLTNLDMRVMDVLGFHRASFATVDEPPLISGVPASVSYQGGRAITLAPNLTVSDADGTTLSSARIGFDGGWTPGQGDGVFVDTSGTNITASFNPARGELFLFGTDTIAHYNQVLDGLVFFLNGNNPTSSGANPTLAVGWQVSDGTATSNYAVTFVTIAPALVGTPGNDSYTAPAGNERIDGHGGIDTITFNFKLTEAHIGWAGGQVFVDGPAGFSHTVLTGFSIYKFTDGTVNQNDGDPLVDNLYYFARNPDVWAAGLDPNAHYHTFGWKEGRDPDPWFSTSTYLSLHPGLKAAGADPLVQFDQGGWKTSDPSVFFDVDAYLAANPDVKAAGVDPLAHFFSYGAAEGREPISPRTLVAPNGFDYVYYLAHNPDVAAARIDPLAHYETSGWREGRNPNAFFDTSGYLAHNPDVAAAGINPLDHYDQSGWREGRDPSPQFDTRAYLAAYPDVAAAHLDPLWHFLQSGINEGRTPHGDGVWN